MKVASVPLITVNRRGVLRLGVLIVEVVTGMREGLRPPETAEGGAESTAVVSVGDLDSLGVHGGELREGFGRIVAAQFRDVHAVQNLVESLRDAVGRASGVRGQCRQQLREWI
ncbi:hypothetical protein [Streptomyces sp. NPDC047315]|uniref:hypothetical protein n=1 Tax=Streptomyces sp. NPDC047315 TaxID=3155142 RepID=UPI0033D20863